MDIVLGVEEKGDENFLIYPNPSQDGVFYFNGLGDQDQYNVEVFDAKGNLVDAFRSKGSLKIDVSQSNKGLYYFKAESSDNVIRGKLMYH